MKSLVYTFIDLLFMGKGVPRKINGIWFRFPARWSRYFESDYEHENVAFLKKHVKAGDQCIDVGAHLGLISMTMARLSQPNGRVYSFEPSHSTFSALKTVLALNPETSAVLPVQMAVGKQAGELSFYESDDEGSNSNSLVATHHLKRRAINVPCTSIDDFAVQHELNRLNVIKVDAEGVELDVLRGAEQVLRKHRPIVVLAIHPRLIRNYGQEPKTIVEFIESLNYTIVHQNKVLNARDFCAIDDFFDVHLVPNKT